MFDKIRETSNDVIIGEPRFDEEVYTYTYKLHASTVARNIDQQETFDIFLGEVGRPFAQKLHIIKDELIKKTIYKRLSDAELCQIDRIINEILSERRL